MATTSRPFLTAEWRMVAMLNYSVDPELLSLMVPRGTELDLFEGKTYISLIGFRFARTRVRGLWIPFHSDFEEVNLRFYLKRKAADETRRGVAFVREIVPRYAIAKVAQLVYGEPYVVLPMTHRIAGPTSEGGRIDVQYRWRIGGTWNTLGVECEGKPQHAAPGSLEQFFTEHYWGYTARHDGSTVEYQVTHDRWRLWPAKSARFTGDCTSLYGAGLAKCLNRSPDSAFLADGSPVMVYPGVRV